MQMDLKSMSRQELEKLLEDVKKALVNAQQRDRREALKAAQKAAAEFGYSLDDLNADGTMPKGRKSKGKSGGTKSAPQYANPADPDQTWTGKGRQPNWYREEVAKGTSPETMKI